MIFDILNNLIAGGKMDNVSLAVFRKDFPSRREFVYGMDINRIDRFHVHVTGGETGYDERKIPLDLIEEIWSDGKLIYTHKKQIKKIYPRK
ncbi:MAG: hypothetical protein JW754_05795 [Candidatus Aenigmarchaeota archaeon]|nr:hypothetical protein [Candidatus Aenigmarchaeota archaeon]